MVPVAEKFPLFRILSLLSQSTEKIKLSGFVSRLTEKPLSSVCPSKVSDEVLISADNVDPEIDAATDRSFMTLFLKDKISAFPSTLIILSVEITPFK